MLTRSKLGVPANENLVDGMKENIIFKAETGGVSTRSRSALGDIRNKTTDALSKNISKQKSGESEQCIAKKKPNMGVDAANLKQFDRLQEFRARRKAIRLQCLASPIAEYFLDFDRIEFGDMATVYPYAGRIFDYLQDRELSLQPLPAHFINSNSEINSRMRYILVNWLVQVHYSYKLQPETLYLCIAIMDRYLMKNAKRLTKDGFQLIGIASLFIAAKFEEMYPPDISDFSSITNNAYSKIDIRNMEQAILQSIDFYLSVPTPLVFLRRFSKAVEVSVFTNDTCFQADRNTHNLAKYFLELTIQEYDLAHLPGNLRAAVSLCMSRAIYLGTSELEQVWNDRLSYLSGYVLDDIRPHLQVLARAAYRQHSPSKYRAIFNKYRVDDFYGRVATLPQLRSQLMEDLADLKFDSDGEVNPA
ncbi:unnamed protein product [Heterobilharzia americana]|nr:unnamed protein product [Heterobilharzia americana]